MDKETLNGFEVFNDFLPGTIANRNTLNTGDEDTKIDMSAVGEELTDAEMQNIRGKAVPTNEGEDTQQTVEDTTDEPTSLVTDNADNTVPSNTTDDESEVVGGFFDALSERLGWDAVEANEKPKTADELISYFEDVIAQNSVPTYASDEVRDLDKFVRNGGKLEDYYKIGSDIDLDNIDINDENDLKSVLRKFLKQRNLTDEVINKKINTYDDAGILAEEAEDALSALKTIETLQRQLLLAEQENRAKAYQQQQRAYFDSVVNEIKGLDSVRGIKIPESDKRVLLEYIFRPTSDGMTRFQKDWASNVRNLIESAYFTMKGDSLIKSAEAKGGNSAINRFKNSLNRTGVSKRTKILDNTSSESMWDSFARRLRVN